MIKIDFIDFWPNFLKHDNYFFNLLSQKDDIQDRGIKIADN